MNDTSNIPCLTFRPLLFGPLAWAWMDSLPMEVEASDDVARECETHHAATLLRINKITAQVLEKHLAARDIALLLEEPFPIETPPAPPVVPLPVRGKTWGYGFGDSEDDNLSFAEEGFASKQEARAALVESLRQGRADSNDRNFLWVNSTTPGGVECEDDAYDTGWVGCLVPLPINEFIDEDSVREHLLSLLENELVWPDSEGASDEDDIDDCDDEDGDDSETKEFVEAVMRELWPLIKDSAAAISGFAMERGLNVWGLYEHLTDVALDDDPDNDPEPEPQQVLVGVGQEGPAPCAWEERETLLRNAPTITLREGLRVLAGLPGATERGGYVATKYNTWQFAPDVLAYLVHYGYVTPRKASPSKA